MIAPEVQFADTQLGALRVHLSGSGPVAVLWHSLFIDSGSWGPIFDALARERTVVAIDGPCHGGSPAVHRDFGFDEVLAAAVQAMDHLGIAEPVDWVGNAWGGHVGILMAAHHPDRIRTLATIGTPVQSMTFAERWVTVRLLVALYRFTGPSTFLLSRLSDALLGAQAVAAEPDRASVVLESLRAADRDAMYHAMRSMMLRRPSLFSELGRISAPTLMLAARDDAMDWQPADAEKACATMLNGRADALMGTGHVSPLLLDSDRIVNLLLGFWDSTAA